jgi:energy-coupling factor transporter ATP-binding protein EcfA2
LPIIADHLSVGFVEGKPILSDISLRIEDGEFVLVLGTSGSGKSIFALTMNGIIPQVIPANWAGSLTVNGRDVTTTTVSEMATQVGLVFQDPDAQLISMFVEDEVVFGPENLGYDRAEIGRRLDYSLDMVGMREFKDQYTWGLSGGQKQRVAISSVLSMRPSILVLDEPTSNLDPEGTRSVFALLARLRREAQMTIIAIEHKVDDLIEHVDRLLVFDKGQIIVNGPPGQAIAEHGPLLLEKGINIPQVSELALRARRSGFSFPAEMLPLTTAEAQTHWPVVGSVIPLEGFGHLHQVRPEPIIRFEAVSFSYPHRPPALRDIHLQIYPGEFVAIVGQNGAGKTTLTKLIAGLLKASHGKVSVNGQDVARTRMERLTEFVGYVFQYPDNQLVTDTVFDEVAFSMRIRQMPEEIVSKRVNQVLDTVEMTRFSQRHPLTLSMGEKRRLSVATMLVLDQKVLILDEPTMGMDWGHVLAIMKICRSLQERGRTVIMVTHDMRVVADWADRVIVMSQGQIAWDSPPRDFFLNTEGLRATRLSQLPVCPWRNCALDASAQCRTCASDFQSILLERYRDPHLENSR